MLFVTRWIWVIFTLEGVMYPDVIGPVFGSGTKKCHIVCDNGLFAIGPVVGAPPEEAVPFVPPKCGAFTFGTLMRGVEVGTFTCGDGTLTVGVWMSSALALVDSATAQGEHAPDDR